jgi:hypothetical protein
MRNHRARVNICKQITACKDMGIDARKLIEMIQMIQMQMGHKPCSSTLDSIDAKALMPGLPAPTQH